MKKTIIIALVLLAMLIPAGTVFAASTAETPEAIQANPTRYTNISSIAPGLSVSGTTGSYSLSVVGATDVTSISAVLQIQKKNSDGTYSDYGASWTASSKTSYLFTSGTKAVASGGTYRLKATVTATNNVTATEIAYSAY